MSKYNRLQIDPAVAAASLRSSVDGQPKANKPDNLLSLKNALDEGLFIEPPRRRTGNRAKKVVEQSAKKHLDGLESALTARSEIMIASLEQKSALQLGLWKDCFDHRLHQSAEQIFKDWKLTKKTGDDLLLTQDQAIQKNSDNFATFKATMDEQMKVLEGLEQCRFRHEQEFETSLKVLRDSNKKEIAKFLKVVEAQGKQLSRKLIRVAS